MFKRKDDNKQYIGFGNLLPYFKCIPTEDVSLTPCIIIYFDLFTDHQPPIQ